jgi:hypothetical protein
MGEEMHKFLVTLAELQAAVALGVSFMQVKEHPGYRRVCGANHVYMVFRWCWRGSRRG